MTGGLCRPNFAAASWWGDGINLLTLRCRERGQKARLYVLACLLGRTRPRNDGCHGRMIDNEAQCELGHRAIPGERPQAFDFVEVFEKGALFLGFFMPVATEVT